MSDWRMYEPFAFGRGAYHPYDNFDTLTRSIRDITRHADHIARALAEQTPNERGGSSQANTQPVSSALCDHADHGALHMAFRPRIDWRETSDGFVLTVVSPGLRKEELKAEVIDISCESFIEVSGQSISTSDTAQSKDAPSDTKTAKPLQLRATYHSFSERVRLPTGVDREGMQAKYEDGLLVVTMPRVKAENVKRQIIAIA
jgi:HSP20 family protein